MNEMLRRYDTMPPTMVGWVTQMPHGLRQSIYRACRSLHLVLRSASASASGYDFRRSHAFSRATLPRTVCRGLRFETFDLQNVILSANGARAWRGIVSSRLAELLVLVWTLSRWLIRIRRAEGGAVVERECV